MLLNMIILSSIEHSDRGQLCNLIIFIEIATYFENSKYDTGSSAYIEAAKLSVS